MIRHILQCLLILSTFLGRPYLSAQDDYYSEDFVYVDNIRSVTFKPVYSPIGFPVIKLHEGERLHLGFDDLDARDKRYTYRIQHFDRNWNVSQIDEMEYLKGFNGEELKDSYHSLHSKLDYVHYDLYLPNEYLSWTISGNYLLIIYDEDDLPVITKRFLVVDPQVSVDAVIKNPRNISKLKSHHSLEISVNHEDFYIRDPMNELTVSVLQNFRWLDAVENVRPKNSIGNNLSFDPFDPFLFPALKEFRNFDTRSLQYTTRYIQSINIKEDRIDVMLEPEKIRSYTNFITELDINGQFIPGNNDYYGLEGAEYVYVGFTLESALPMEGHEVYVIGGFSDWQAYETNRMNYDPESQVYRGSIMLKQGFYDYYYALLDDKGQIDLETLEGNWYETDNSYFVLVYLREFGGLYDQLIALAEIK